MGDSFLWWIHVHLFLVALMRLVRALVEACMIASEFGLNSPFNLRRYA